MNPRVVDEILGRIHRHRSSYTRRRVLRHVAGNVYRVLVMCRCGATREELIRWENGTWLQGEILEATAWTEVER